MSMLDGIIREVARRFELGDKAGPLVSAFLGFIAIPKRGGIRGFVDRFRQAGLGNQVDSWLGKGPNEISSLASWSRSWAADNLERISSSAGFHRPRRPRRSRSWCPRSSTC